MQAVGQRADKLSCRYPVSTAPAPDYARWPLARTPRDSLTPWSPKHARSLPSNRLELRPRCLPRGSGDFRLAISLAQLCSIPIDPWVSPRATDACVARVFIQLVPRRPCRCGDPLLPAGGQPATIFIRRSPCGCRVYAPGVSFTRFTLRAVTTKIGDDRATAYMSLLSTDKYDDRSQRGCVIRPHREHRDVLAGHRAEYDAGDHAHRSAAANGIVSVMPIMPMPSGQPGLALLLPPASGD